MRDTLIACTEAESTSEVVQEDPFQLNVPVKQQLP